MGGRDTLSPATHSCYRRCSSAPSQNSAGHPPKSPCPRSLLVPPLQALDLLVLPWHHKQQLRLPLPALRLQHSQQTRIKWLPKPGSLRPHMHSSGSVSLRVAVMREHVTGQNRQRRRQQRTLSSVMSPTASPRTASSKACRASSTCVQAPWAASERPRQDEKPIGSTAAR